MLAVPKILFSRFFDPVQVWAGFLFFQVLHTKRQVHRIYTFFTFAYCRASIMFGFAKRRSTREQKLQRRDEIMYGITNKNDLLDIQAELALLNAGETDDWVPADLIELDFVPDSLIF